MWLLLSVLPCVKCGIAWVDNRAVERGCKVLTGECIRYTTRIYDNFDKEFILGQLRIVHLIQIILEFIV